MEGFILLSVVILCFVVFLVITRIIALLKNILSLQEKVERRVYKLQYQLNNLSSSILDSDNKDIKKNETISKNKTNVDFEHLLDQEFNSFSKNNEVQQTLIVEESEVIVSEKNTLEYPENEPNEFSVCENVSEEKNNFVKNFFNWFLYGGDSAEIGTQTIGAVWLLRSAVLIILCGVFFFLKYSVDNGFITPFWRFFSTILGGAGALFAGYKSERSYKILPQGLYSIGFVVIFAAFCTGNVFYNLYSVQIAVFLMIAISLVAGITAYLKDYQISACLSVVGMYMASILLYSHSANIFFPLLSIAFAVLFIIILSLFKGWTFAAWLGLVGGYGIISVFLCIADKTIIFISGIIVLSLIFIIHTIYLNISSIIMNKKSGISEILYFYLNSIWYFILSGILITINISYRYSAWVSIGLFFVGILNIFLLRRQSGRTFDLSFNFEKAKDKVLDACNCGHVALFTVVTIFLLLSGSVLCVALSILGLIMLYIGTIEKNKILFSFSAFLYLLSLVHLIFVEFSLLACRMHSVYALSIFEYTLPFIFFIISTALGAWIIYRIPQFDLQYKLSAVLYSVSISVLFVFLSFETVRFVTNFISKDFTSGAVSILWSLFGLAFLLKGLKKNKNSFFRNLGFIMFAIVVCKVFFIDIVALKAYYRIAAFIILGFILLFSSIFYEKVIKE